SFWGNEMSDEQQLRASRRAYQAQARIEQLHEWREQQRQYRDAARAQNDMETYHAIDGGMEQADQEIAELAQHVPAANRVSAEDRDWMLKRPEITGHSQFLQHAKPWHDHITGDGRGDGKGSNGDPDPDFRGTVVDPSQDPALRNRDPRRHSMA